jgi:hypothetical protein
VSVRLYLTTLGLHHPAYLVDTICTAQSLMPTVIGNTFAASLRRTSVRSERKLVHCLTL